MGFRKVSLSVEAACRDGGLLPGLGRGIPTHWVLLVDGDVALGPSIPASCCGGLT